jgi:serine protease Do
MSKFWNFIIVFLLILISCNAEDKNIDHVYVNGNSDLSLNNQQSEQIKKNNDELYNSRQNSITNAISIGSPAIVGINVTEVRQVIVRDPFLDDPFFNQFYRRFYGDNPSRRTRDYEVRGLGSGFIISPDGYILTNHHVAGNASKIVITMTDGNKYDAEIIGSDMVSDVALLKIDAKKKLPFIKLGNSDDLIIGEWVIAFGNPFGLFDINAKPTVTVGVISNDGIDLLHEDQPYNRIYRGMIQTDAAISSGNSGGPLLNSLGEVIGMNTIIYSTSQGSKGAGSIGIGFSIPINRVKTIIDLLKQKKTIERDFYTGIDARQLDEQLAKMIKLDNIEGVVVFGMQRNSPAEKAGLELGDVIISIEGNKILRIDDYYINVGDKQTGESVTFTILRNGKTLTKKIILEQVPRR